MNTKLQILLEQHCQKDSYECKLDDKQPKILFKNGLTPNFIKVLGELVIIKLIASTYKNSSFHRQGYNLIVFIQL